MFLLTVELAREDAGVSGVCRADTGIVGMVNGFAPPSLTKIRQRAVSCFDSASANADKPLNQKKMT